MKTVFTKQFDLAGNGVSRTIKMLMFNRIVPVGNLAGGGGLRCLLVLAVLHVCGRPIFQLLIRLNQSNSILFKVLKRLRR
jgi:hypothetical protein